MDKDKSPEMILQGLMNAIGSTCPECGEANPSNVNTCDSCGAEIPIHEDEPSLSFVHADGIVHAPSPGVVGEDLTKTPLHESGNLKLLRETVDKVKKGQIQREEYRENVSRVLSDARNAEELVTSRLFLKKIEDLPDEYKETAGKSAELFGIYVRGCRIMLEYDGGKDGTKVIKGFAMVEDALRKIDHLQDRAIQLAKEAEEEDEDEDEDEEDESEDQKI